MRANFVDILLRRTLIAGLGGTNLPPAASALDDLTLQGL